MSVLIYAMIYAGSALMVYNIVRCHGFVKRMRTVNGLEKTQRILPVPLILLVFFLIGCGILTVGTSMVPVFVGSMFMLSGYLGAVACFGAAIRNNTPAGRVGLYQGVRIFMVVLVPMLIGPWIGSAISASSGAMVGFGVVGDGFTPSSLIFAGGACVALLTFVVLAFIRRLERRARDE